MGINKLLEKSQKYNNFFKSQLSKNPSIFLIVNLIVFIIFILFHSFIIYYLVNLKKCLCFEELNNKNYSNINYLIILESLTLLPGVLGLISVLILIYYTNKKQKGGSENTKISYIVFYIMYGIILLINIYFLYNVKKLAENVKEDCECSHSWIRYLLYIYSIYIVYTVISVIITLYT